MPRLGRKEETINKLNPGACTCVGKGVPFFPKHGEMGLRSHNYLAICIWTGEDLPSGTYVLSRGVGGPLPILPCFEFQKSQSALGGTVHRPGVGTDPEPPSASCLFLTECENPVLQSLPSMYTILYILQKHS